MRAQFNAAAACVQQMRTRVAIQPDLASAFRTALRRVASDESTQAIMAQRMTATQCPGAVCAFIVGIHASGASGRLQRHDDCSEFDSFRSNDYLKACNFWLADHIAACAARQAPPPWSSSSPSTSLLRLPTDTPRAGLPGWGTASLCHRYRLHSQSRQTTAYPHV